MQPIQVKSYYGNLGNKFLAIQREALEQRYPKVELKGNNGLFLMESHEFPLIYGMGELTSALLACARRKGNSDPKDTLSTLSSLLSKLKINLNYLKDEENLQKRYFSAAARIGKVLPQYSAEGVLTTDADFFNIGCALEGRQNIAELVNYAKSHYPNHNQYSPRYDYDFPLELFHINSKNSLQSTGFLHFFSTPGEGLTRRITDSKELPTDEVQA